MSPCAGKASSRRLENIEEDSPSSWPVQSTCAPPETPTESMEFLARSWSLSAVELSKALSTTHTAPCPTQSSDVDEDVKSTSSKETLIQPLQSENSPPTSPRNSEELKELLLYHQALNQDYLSGQQPLKNGVYKSIVRGKTKGRWLKDQKKQEARTQNAQLHAAVSVAGVAAAVAALAASTVTSPENSTKEPPKTSAAIVSAAALVASHCIDIAEEMGADHDHILSVVNSAINARTNGDIMTLTAGAATALRGAATLKARLLKGPGATTYTLYDEKGEESKESNISTALNFVCRGGELLKLTRKGDLHWKQVSFSMDSNGQVVAKMKSKHMAGTFTKKKKCVVTRVYYDVPVWPGKDSSEQRAYFGIKTVDRIIQFECKSKGDKQIWIEGIRVMLNYRTNIT